MTQKGGDYHDSVASSFRSLAEQDPQRYRVVNAQGSVDEVTARLLEALEDLL